jgi:hypothetical protein
MAILGLILGVLGVLGVMAGPVVPFEPEHTQVSGSIQVLSTSHVVDFPSGVVLSLQLRSTADISDIQVFYRLGNQTVTSYGYPDFQPGSLVDTSFELRTDGDDFLPQGIVIRYRYVITDTTGQKLETEEYSVEYLDTSKSWQRLQVGDMDLLFHDRDYEGVESVAEDVTKSLRDVKQLLGVTAIRPQKAVILNGEREAQASFPPISQTTSDRHVYGGFAFGDLDVFVLADLDRDGMVHEMTHLYMDEVLSAPRSRIPAWLNEGLAMYFEDGDKGRRRTVSRASISGNLLSIRSMGRVPGRPDDVGLFYAQSWSVVGYLMDSHDDDRMVDLLNYLKRGRSFDPAFEASYGFDVEELDRQWRASVRRGAAISALPDPGTIGTSVLIAGAMAFAMLVILIRRIRGVTAPEGEGEEDVEFEQ